MIKHLILPAAIVMLASFAVAATPEEETRFLGALKDAYANKDRNALDALVCWERVSDEMKAQSPKMFEMMMRPRVKAMRYVPIDPNDKHTYNYKGAAYAPNIPITKEIEIEFESESGSSAKSHVFLGEKDGKLLIASPAPQP